MGMTMTAVVTVVGFWLDLLTSDNRPRVVRRWRIEYGAFVAEIPECPCGLHGALSSAFRSLRRSGKRTNCLCKSEACHNNPERKGVCHGWHEARVMAMVAAIEAPKPWKHAVVGVPSSRLAPRDFAGMNGYRWKDVR